MNANVHLIPPSQPFYFESPFLKLNPELLGEQFWHLRRQRWTSQTTIDLESRRSEGMLMKTTDAMSRDAKLKIYEKFIEQRKSLARPLNLSQLIPVLKAGWIKNGLWPEGQEAPPDSE